METDFVNRRRYTRIYLKAFGFNRTARLSFPGGTYIVNLIDISPGGCRVKLDQDVSMAGFSYGDKLQCTPLLSGNKLELVDIPSIVRWIAEQERELGIEFKPPLQIYALELQEMMS